ncbi:MAG: PD-(D/E)XK nuclease family protein [Candidatus Heimdallarchaeota archaeon]|nr:PD-(D/E)XK nuclease family protein [Candidatus Heimdallarchaeota archaeon]
MKEGNQNSMGSSDMLDTQRSLFSEMKQIIHSYVKRNSHDYIPKLGEFRASSIPYCKRKILLEKDITRYLKPEIIESIKSDEKEELFGSHISGQIIHEAIQDALQVRVESIEGKVGVSTGKYSLVGHYDLLIRDNDGDLVVIDIKTTMKPVDQLPVAPHTIQLMAYQGMLGGIKGGLLYVNRNSWEMFYYSQNFVKPIFSQLIIKIAELGRDEELQILPEPIPEYHSECGNDFYKCKYYSYCFPEGKELNKIDKNND